MAAQPLFLIGAPYGGRPASRGNGMIIALLAPDSDAVDHAYNLAIQGQGLCEETPGPRPEYHEGYYGAYLRDQDGHKICICAARWLHVGVQRGSSDRPG